MAIEVQEERLLISEEGGAVRQHYDQAHIVCDQLEGLESQTVARIRRPM